MGTSMKPVRLTRAQSTKLVDEVLEERGQTNEHLMRRLRARMDAVGVEVPTVEVQFEDLRAESAVYVGTRGLPSLINFFRNGISVLLELFGIAVDSRRPFPILHGVSGVLKPGRLTLLLGPPGSGKSTLMKLLRGIQEDGLKVSGDITYNGKRLHEFVPEGTASYVPQTDAHIGELTVRETLDFSRYMQGPGMWASVATAVMQESGVSSDLILDSLVQAAVWDGGSSGVITDYVLKILALDVCAETMLGNDLIRGVSGGQRKRVTIGEALVGSKQVQLMDEITTGLDSSTAFLVTSCIRNYAHAMNATVMIVLLQPAPETYELFDDVMLMSEGHIVYHGPRTEVLAFFEHMGFRCPERKGVADFLQEVTSLRDQEQYWCGDAPYSFVSVEQFVGAFRETVHGKQISATLSAPFTVPRMDCAGLAAAKYGLSPREMLRGTFEREWLLMKRNSGLYVAQTLNLLVVALITGTVFFRTRLSTTVGDGTFYLGAMFFSLLKMLINGLAELTMLLGRLPVFYKQRRNNLYSAAAWFLPMAALAVPFSLWAAAIWTGVLYYITGFAPQADRFFYQMLIFFLVHQISIGLFRLVGSVARNEVIANTYGAFLLIVLFTLGGFIIAKADIHSYWVWAFWMSPVSYAQNALAVNEFLAPRWKIAAPPPEGDMSVGMVVLYSHSFFSQPYWRTIAVGALVGFIAVINALTVLALATLGPPGQGYPAVSEESLRESRAARTGEMAGWMRRKMPGEEGNSGGPRMRPPQPLIVKVTESGMEFPEDQDLELEGEREGEGGLFGPTGSLPFRPLTLSFHDLNYYVDMPAQMKAEGASAARMQLLRGVTGAFRPGVLTALVGVSGAGKTTLMDILSGRAANGYLEGDIRVSGYPKVQETFARVSGYCEQNDIHSPQVTVYESLLFSAALRLPRSMSREARAAFVEETMRLVELDSLRDALVGIPGVDGLSTEQRKRLTIAVELVANPSIIFMDEPTSGLDARAAAIVMRTVRSTVDTGRTVVCTIHQPSIDIFESFDEVLFLQRGGQVIYTGPLGPKSEAAIKYFESIPGVPPIKEGQNPATWMLQLSTSAGALGVDFADEFRESEEFRSMETLVEALKTPPTGQLDLSFPTSYAASHWRQYLTCLWKRNLTYWRAPEYNGVRFFYCAIVGLLIGSVFFGFGKQRSTQQQLLNLMGAMFMVAVFMGWNNSSAVQPVVAVERPVFYREYASGYYAALPYALAQGAMELPYTALQTLIYSVLTYTMIQLEWTGPKFLWYLLFMFFTILYYTYYGMMAMAVTPNQQLAMVLSAFFFSIWNLLSGFILPGPRIPWWWRWFYYINPMSWALYGLVTSQLGDINTPVDVPGLANTPTVQQFLSVYFGYHHSRIGFVAIFLSAFVLLFFSIFTIALKQLKFHHR